MKTTNNSLIEGFHCFQQTIQKQKDAALDQTFRQLDIIIQFYSSISENILDTAVVNFAKQYTDVFDKNLGIIKHYCKSLLYNNHEPQKRKDTDSCSDVTMGSYDGVEVCKLVGIYLLCLLVNIDKNNSGLYRDGLIFLRNVNE